MKPTVKPARGIYAFAALNAALTLLFALIRYLTRAHHFGPHANGVPVYHRNFADLLDFTTQFRYFHQPAFFHQTSVFVYPAPLAVVYRFFFLFGNQAAAAFAVVLLLVFVTAAILFARALMRRGLDTLPAVVLSALALLFAWPVWFCLKQGNMEFVLFAFFAVGLCAFLRGKSLLAATCFGVAGVMKIYPLIFLGLLLATRRYRAFFFGLAIAAATLLLSLWLVCPDLAVSWHGMLTGLGSFRGDYILRYQTAQSGLDHSLFGLVKLAFATLGHFGFLHNAERMNHLTIAYVVVAALAGLTLWIVCIRHLPVTNQVLALTVAAILLPPVSVEYTLMHLYLPWAMLVFIALQGRESQSAARGPLLLAFVLLGVLLSPLTELWLLGWGLAGELKAVLLLLLFAISLKIPLPGSESAASPS